MPKERKCRVCPAHHAPGCNHTRRTTPATPQPKRRSLMSLSPKLGTCFLVTGLASGAILSLFFSLHPPRQTAVIALSLLFFFAHSGSLIFILFNPSVKPLPDGPGNSVFLYCAAWAAFQMAGYVCLYHDRWLENSPAYLKRWASAWLVMSVLTVWMVVWAVTLVMTRRMDQRDEDIKAMRMTRERRRRHEEMAHVEHVEFSQPPPVYKVLPYLESGELKR